jgi:hypothetical protein
MIATTTSTKTAANDDENDINNADSESNGNIDDHGNGLNVDTVPIGHDNDNGNNNSDDVDNFSNNMPTTIKIEEGNGNNNNINNNDFDVLPSKTTTALSNDNIYISEDLQPTTTREDLDNNDSNNDINDNEISNNDINSNTNNSEDNTNPLQTIATPVVDNILNAESKEPGNPTLSSSQSENFADSVTSSPTQTHIDEMTKTTMTAAHSHLPSSNPDVVNPDAPASSLEEDSAPPHSTIVESSNDLKHKVR